MTIWLKGLLTTLLIGSSGGAILGGYFLRDPSSGNLNSSVLSDQGRHTQKDTDHEKSQLEKSKESTKSSPEGNKLQDLFPPFNSNSSCIEIWGSI